MAYKAYKGSGVNLSQNKKYNQSYQRDQERFEAERLRQENERNKRMYEEAQQYLPEENRNILDRATDLLSVGQYATQGLLQDGVEGMWEGIKASNPFGDGNEDGEYTFKGTLEKYGDWENINPDINSAGDALRALKGGDVKGFATAFGKGAVEFAGDVLLDPTTYLTGGVSNLAKGTGKKVGKETLEEVAESTVRELLEKSNKNVLDKDVTRYTNKINKARGINVDAEDFRFGIKNHNIKLANAETLQNIGDKTIAPVINLLKSEIKDSGLGKLFNNSYAFRQMSLNNPEQAVKYMEFLDMGKWLKDNKLVSDKEILQFANEISTNFDADTQRQIIDFLEKPNKFKKVVKYKQANEDVLETFKKMKESMFAQNDEVSGRITSSMADYDKIKLLLGGSEDDMVSNLYNIEDEHTKKLVKQIIDPDGEFKTFDDMIEGMVTSDSYDAIIRNEGDFDDVIDGWENINLEEEITEIGKGDSSDYFAQPKSFDLEEEITKHESVPEQIVEEITNESVPTKQRYEGMPDEEYIKQFSNADDVTGLPNDLNFDNVEPKPKDSPMKQYIKEREREKRKLGYLPKLDEARFAQEGELLRKGLMQHIMAMRKDVSWKADYLNKVLYRGRKVLDESMGEATANRMIQAIYDGDIKTVRNNSYSATPKGQEVYKNLMSKYGTIFEDAEVGKVEVALDDLETMKANGQAITPQALIDKSRKTTGRKGKQIFYSSDDFYKHYASEEKVYKDLEAKKSAYGYKKALNEQGAELKELRKLRDELTNGVDDYQKLSAMNREIGMKQKRYDQLNNQVKKLEKQFGEVLEWNEADELDLENAYNAFKEKFDFAEPRRLNRKAELEYVRDLERHQYDYFLERYKYAEFDKIDPYELERIQNLSMKDIQSEFEREMLDTAYKPTDDAKRMYDGFNELEDKKRNKADIQQQYRDEIVESNYAKTLDDDSVIYPLKDGTFVDAPSRVALKKNKTIQKKIDAYIDDLPNQIQRQLPKSPITDPRKQYIIDKNMKVANTIKKWVDFYSVPGNRNKKFGNFDWTLDEVIDDVMNSDSIEITLATPQINKLVGSFQNGGMMPNLGDLPYVSGTNQYDTLRSVVALSMNKPVDVISKNGELLATNRRTYNGFEVRGKSLKVKQEVVTKHKEFSTRKTQAKKLAEEVKANGYVSSVEDIVRTIMKDDGKMPGFSDVSRKTVDVEPVKNIEGANKVIDDFYSSNKPTVSSGNMYDDLIAYKNQLTQQINDMEVELDGLNKRVANDETLTEILNVKLADMDEDMIENYAVKDGIPYLKEIERRLDYGNEHFPEDAKELINTMMDKFKTMAHDEKRLGKLSNMVKDYVPHIINPELISNPQFEQVLKEQDKEIWERMIKFKGTGEFNPFSMSRTLKGSIAEVNKHMTEMFKRAGYEFEGDFFITNLAEIYQARALKNNELLYADDFTKSMFNNFGSRVDYKEIYDMKKPLYISTSNLRETLKIVPENKRNELVELLGFKMDRTYNKPIIKLDGEEARKFGMLFDRYTDNASNMFLEIFDVPDSVIKHADDLSQTMMMKDMNQALRMYDKFLGLWKANVTYLMPGFHFRNTYSNAFTNWLDVGAKTFDPKFNGEISKIVKGMDGEIKLKNGDVLSYERIRELAEIHNVAGDLFNTELTGGVDKSLKDAFKTGNYNPLDLDNFKGYKMGRYAGGKIEGHARMVNFVGHLQQGMSPEDAIELTDKFLFDYNDLTSFEKQFMRRAIPFYTFIKKNAGLQIDQLLNNPGKYSVVLKAQSKAKESGDMERQYLPEFMEDWIQLPLTVTNPDGEEEQMMWNPNLPYSALNDLIPTPQNVIGKLTPAVKVPLELMMNKNIYFDSPITNKADYLLEQTGTLNQIVDTFDKQGLDKVQHLGNFLGGVKTSSVPINQYKQQAMSNALKRVQKKYKDKEKKK